MKASLGKRATAYLIDLTVLLVILGLINILYKPDISDLNADTGTLTLAYAEGDVTFNTYMTDLSSIYKQIDIKNIFLNIINVLFIIGYFIVLPYLNGGKTIGKLLMKIEVRSRSNQPLTLTKLIVRNLIINGLIYFIAVIFCALFIPENIYFTVITALGLIQIGLLSASVIMVLYRKDKKGLHDLIAGTWVTNTR